MEILMAVYRRMSHRVIHCGYIAVCLALGVAVFGGAQAQSLNTRTHTPPGAAAKESKLIGKSRVAGAQEGRTLLPRLNQVPCGASIGGTDAPSGAASRVQSLNRPQSETVILGDVVVDCGK